MLKLNDFWERIMSSLKSFFENLMDKLGFREDMKLYIEMYENSPTTKLINAIIKKDHPNDNIVYGIESGGGSGGGGDDGDSGGAGHRPKNLQF